MIQLNILFYFTVCNIHSSHFLPISWMYSIVTYPVVFMIVKWHMIVMMNQNTLQIIIFHSESCFLELISIRLAVFCQMKGFWELYSVLMKECHSISRLQNSLKQINFYREMTAIFYQIFADFARTERNIGCKSKPFMTISFLVKVHHTSWKFAT